MIGTSPHQLVSDISGLPRGIILFALDSYLFITYSPQKAPKNILVSTILSPVVPCNFIFRFALLSLCLWLSLVAGFDCVRRRSLIAPLLFLVSTAIPSTVSKQQVEATTLLDLPPLAALCDLLPPR